MIIVTIRLTSKFQKAYKKLSVDIKDEAKNKETVFRQNPFDPILKTHKLHGRYKNYWAFSINGQYRIMFAFADVGTVDFINIGTHEIYR